MGALQNRILPPQIPPSTIGFTEFIAEKPPTFTAIICADDDPSLEIQFAPERNRFSGKGNFAPTQIAGHNWRFYLIMNRLGEEKPLLRAFPLKYAVGYGGVGGFASEVIHPLVGIGWALRNAYNFKFDIQWDDRETNPEEQHKYIFALSF